MAAERTYALTKIVAGDYLLPSNDATILWRISRYWEDGSLERGTWNGGWKVVRGWEWQAAWMLADTFQMLADRDPLEMEGPLEWEHWNTYATGYATRAEAIEEAITATPRRD